MPPPLLAASSSCAASDHDTDEDEGGFGHRDFTMNPELAMAAMGQEDMVFEDVLMKSAIAHRLKKNTSSRDLSFTITELLNMLQALIDNRDEIIALAVLSDRSLPSHVERFAPRLEQALPAKLSKRRSCKEPMADSLAEIYFLWKDIARCPDVALALPHERTKLGSALSDFTVALVRVHTFCKAELEAERSTRKALKSEQISGE
jgi:hypothetical protein